MKSASIAKTTRALLTAMICFSTCIDESIAMSLTQARTAQRVQAPTQRQSQDLNQKLEGQVDCVDCGVQDAMPGIGEQNQRNIEGLSGFAEGLLQNVNVFAGEDGKDKRKKVSRTGMYAPIGKIETDLNDGGNRLQGAMSTAFMISPCYIRATRHGIFGDNVEAADAKSVVRFSVGDGKGGKFKHEKIKATPVAWGPASEDVGDDWAILKLDSCVGGDPEVGWMEMVIGADSYKGEVVSAGYAGDHNPVGKNQLVADKCEILDRHYAVVGAGEKIYQSAFKNYCGSAKGDSGAPLFKIENGVPKVLAVQTAVVSRRIGIIKDRDLNFAAIAASVSASRKAARNLVNEDVLAFGRPNPLHGRTEPMVASRDTRARDI